MLSGSIARNATRNLAASLKRQGKYAAEAETIYCTVLGVMKRVLGAEHSITLLTANNLATFLAHQDEPAKPSGQQPRMQQALLMPAQTLPVTSPPFHAGERLQAADRQIRRSRGSRRSVLALRDE